MSRNEITGVVLMAAGVAVGVYFGFWWAFVGGIVDIVSEIRSDDMNAICLALGVAKVFLSTAIGWLSAMVGIVPGLVLVKKG